jgi:hypothetical protein
MLLWLLLGGGAFVLLVIAALAVVLTFGDQVQVVDTEGELVDSRPVLEHG